jgi:hypothetical protein
MTCQAPIATNYESFYLHQIELIARHVIQKHVRDETSSALVQLLRFLVSDQNIHRDRFKSSMFVLQHTLKKLEEDSSMVDKKTWSGMMRARLREGLLSEEQNCKIVSWICREIKNIQNGNEETQMIELLKEILSRSFVTTTNEKFYERELKILEQEKKQIESIRETIKTTRSNLHYWGRLDPEHVNVSMQLTNKLKDWNRFDNAYGDMILLLNEMASLTGQGDEFVLTFQIQELVDHRKILMKKHKESQLSVIARNQALVMAGVLPVQPVDTTTHRTIALKMDRLRQSLSRSACSNVFTNEDNEILHSMMIDALVGVQDEERRSVISIMMNVLDGKVFTKNRRSFCDGLQQLQEQQLREATKIGEERRIRNLFLQRYTESNLPISRQ